MSGATSAQQHHVFVYGTLKRDEPNHHVLTDPTTGTSKLTGHGTTTQPYPLVIASRYNIPFLLDRPGMGKPVTGDIFLVDDAKLAALDELESHPTYYVRRLEPIKFLSESEHSQKPDDNIIQCWTYFLPRFRDQLLSLPMLSEYSSKGAHGLEYVASDDDIESESDIYD